MRVLITGSRIWSEKATLRGALMECLRSAEDGLTVVHGAASKGADAMAAAWVEHWERKGAPVRAEPHPASWGDPCRADCHRNHRHCQAKLGRGVADDHAHVCGGKGGHGPHVCVICGLAWRQDPYPNTCPAAGIYRNLHMVSLGADLCLAFIVDNSSGSSHCADAAARAGIDVFYFRASTPLAA
jgi:hypothetical protein